MRYAPPGLCVNDFALLEHEDGGYSALHLQGPWTEDFDHLRMETSYGLATSRDLVAWQPGGPAFGTGLPGRFDQRAVWTMHPFCHGTGLAMLYTGVASLTPDGWPLQAVGLAYSDRLDGAGWRRYGTAPVIEADPRWYRTGERMAWRDPFVVRDDEPGGGWVAVLCASDAARPVEVSGAVAFATSQDLEHWQVHPPLISPGDIDELECPILERVADGWLLLGCVGATRRIEAWSADRLRGPWTRRGPLAPSGVYAPRIVTAPDGGRVLLHTAARRVGLTDTGAYCRGMLAQPKRLVAAPGSAPSLHWWGGLDRWLGAPTTAPTLHAVAEIDVDGPLTVTLRTSEPGGNEPAVFVVCAGRQLSINGRNAAVLARTMLPTVPSRLRILTIGEYVEVYADDRFVLTALSYSGHRAPWMARTAAWVRAVPVRPVRLPQPARDDASAVWPGPDGS